LHIDLNTSKQNQNQFDQQIEQSLDEIQSSKKITSKNQINISSNEALTIDLSTSSQKLDELFYRKRKTEEKRQNALKKKFDSVKIFTLVLSMNETLKNAQKILFEELKIAKIEQIII
jgi:hypothetical protein